MSMTMHHRRLIGELARILQRHVDGAPASSVRQQVVQILRNLDTLPEPRQLEKLGVGYFTKTVWDGSEGIFTPERINDRSVAVMMFRNPFPELERSE